MTRILSIALAVILIGCSYQYAPSGRQYPAIAVENPESFPASARMTSPVSLRLDQAGQVAVEVMVGESQQEDWFNIDATKTVSVFLFTPLSITRLSPDNQPIFVDLTTRWNWTIIGDQPGTHYLDVVVWGHTNVNGERHDYLIDHIRSGVTVVATPAQITKRWLSFYWQWLLTTLIIPFGVWVWSSRATLKRLLKGENSSSR
jgi:hypothetical protein